MKGKAKKLTTLLCLMASCALAVFAGACSLREEVKEWQSGVKESIESTAPTESVESSEETPAPARYTITYMMASGGQLSNVPQLLIDDAGTYPTSYEEGAAVTVSDLRGRGNGYVDPENSCKDYKFYGWYMDQACTQAVKDWDNWTGNVVLFAKVEQNVLTPAEAIKRDIPNIVLNLTEETLLPTTVVGRGDIWGGETTKTITINGNGNTVVLKNTYDAVIEATDGAKLIFNDVKIKTERDVDSTWNVRDIVFKNATELNDVDFAQEIAFFAIDEKVTLNNVTVATTQYDMYAIWIVAGTKVEMNNCTVSSVKGRAIKICDEYEGEVGLTELTVKNTTFSSAKKAAILVGSIAGAKITLENVDVSKVAADTENEVWVDSDYQATMSKVEVIGGNMRYEG